MVVKEERIELANLLANHDLCQEDKKLKARPLLLKCQNILQAGEKTQAVEGFCST